jgi:glycosyltransferase involved in cell wall biosynthesis
MLHAAPLPPISVVVCTRDRPALLARCLAALQELDYPACEVVVVDSASRSSDTAQVVAATPYRYVREAQPGLDIARNRGAAEAQHAIIAYIDDDALAAPGWLRGMASAFSAPEVALVTGRVLPAELATLAQRLFEQYSGMDKGTQPRIFQRRTLRPPELIAVQHVGVGANMALRRSALAALGGFDPALDVGRPAGGAGDLDLFHRALAAGLTLRYEPSALAYHRHRREMHELWQQLYQNGQSFGVYLLKLGSRRTVPRRAVVRFALGWVGGWLLARLAACLLGRLHFPLELIWAELWGALHAPAAYRATYRHTTERMLQEHEKEYMHDAEPELSAPTSQQ